MSKNEQYTIGGAIVVLMIVALLALRKHSAPAAIAAPAGDTTINLGDTGNTVPYLTYNLPPSSLADSLPTLAGSPYSPSTVNASQSGDCGCGCGGNAGGNPMLYSSAGQLANAFSPTLTQQLLDNFASVFNG